jgi:hypothetical protein
MNITHAFNTVTKKYIQRPYVNEELLKEDEVVVTPKPCGNFDWVGGEWVSLGLTESETLHQEVTWVSAELRISDLQLNMLADGDSRATHTEAAWRGYRVDLRNYVKAGIVIGERPAIGLK